MKATSVLIFDKENKQEDYQYIARDMNNKLIIGWIVVEQPWYSNKSDWKYWMYSNKYSRGFCGGASDLGLDRTLINPDTIKPFNQIEKIKFDLENGMKVRLDKKFYCFDDEASDDNVLTIINNVNEIPYELWA